MGFGWLEHPHQRPIGGFADLLGDLDAWIPLFQSLFELLQGVHLHERALAACASVVLVRRGRDQFLVRRLFPHLVEDAPFRGQDEALSLALLYVGEHLGRGAHVMGQFEDGLLRFRMSEELGARSPINFMIRSMEKASWTLQTPSQSSMSRPVTSIR